MFRESRMYKGCMEDVQEFQVFFALIFPENLYKTQTYECCRGFCRIYKFDIFWIKFVPLEMKTLLNIENSLWIVITPYP